jgi:hypothetical protein
MPLAGFEPTIPASQRPQTHALQFSYVYSPKLDDQIQERESAGHGRESKYIEFWSESLSESANLEEPGVGGRIKWILKKTWDGRV